MNLAEDSGRSAPISAAGEPTPLSAALPAQPLVDGGTSPPGGPHSPHKPAASAAFSKRLMEAGRADAGAVLEMIKSASDGLTTAAAADRLAEIGPNTVAEEVAFGAFRRMLRAARNPLVILLTIIAAVSFWTGDFRGGVVISIMVVLGISLRFLQESRADAAAAK